MKKQKAWTRKPKYQAKTRFDCNNVSLHLRFRKIKTNHQRAIAGHTSRKDHRHRGPQRQWKNNTDKTDARILSSHGGTVTIGNQSLQKISFKEWRKHCGVVMQEGFIFGDTIANNIVPDGSMIDKKTPAVCRRNGKHT